VKIKPEKNYVLIEEELEKTSEGVYTGKNVKFVRSIGDGTETNLIVGDIVITLGYVYKDEEFEICKIDQIIAKVEH